VIKAYPHWFGSREKHYFYGMPTDPVFSYCPPQRQDTGYGCSKVSILAVLHKAGYGKAEEEAVGRMKISPRYGASHEELYAVLRGAEIPYFYGYHRTLRQLGILLSSGFNPIVNYTVDGVGHYSVAVGLGEDKVWIRDVWDGKIKSYERAAFDKMWYSKSYGDHWFLVITNKFGRGGSE
jgi:hypothetical protein